LKEKCSGAGRGGHQLEIDCGDAGEGTEGAGEYFCEIEASHVFDDHSARLDDAALESRKLHSDDEIADGAEQTAAVSRRVGSEDAADGGVIRKRRFDGQELLFFNKDGGEVGIPHASFNADGQVARIVSQNAIQRFGFNADSWIADGTAGAHLGPGPSDFNLLIGGLAVPHQLGELPCGCG